jgi:WD40 repeat protein
LDGRLTAYVWDLQRPSEAEPTILRAGLDASTAFVFGTDPSGRWLVSVENDAIFWPIPEDPVMVFSGFSGGEGQLTFTPDSKNLVIQQFSDGGFRIQPLEAGVRTRTLLPRLTVATVGFHPSGEHAVVTAGTASVGVVPLDGSRVTALKGFDGSAYVLSAAYDHERGLVAGGCLRGPPDQKVIRVWNLQEGSVNVLGPTEGAGDSFDGGYRALEFLPDGGLLSSAHGDGVRRWSLEDGTSQKLLPGDCGGLLVPADRSFVVAVCAGGVITVLDLETDEVRRVESFKEGGNPFALSPAGDLIAVGTPDGDVLVRPLSGGEPHKLLGHETQIQEAGLAFSPDGSLLASIDRSGIARVWHVPDMTKPPRHTIPIGEFLAWLDTLTNVRIVRDETSPTDWRRAIGPFPGWETVPEW